MRHSIFLITGFLLLLVSPAVFAQTLSLPADATPYALLQFQGVALAQSGALPSRGDRTDANDPTMNMRRMRVGVRGTLSEDWKWHIMADLSRTDMMYEAWVRWTKYKAFNVKVGNYVVEVGRGQDFYPGAMSLPEFAYASKAFSLFRQAGVQFLGTLPGGFRYSSGVFVAPTRAGTFWQGYKEDGGVGASKADGLGLYGRAMWEPLGLVGDRSPHDTDGGPLRFQLAADYMRLSGSAFNTDAVSASFHAKWYGAHLLAEFLRDRALEQRQAVWVEAGYTLQGWVVAARGEYLQPNLAKPELTEHALSGAIGVPLGSKVNVRLQLDQRNPASGAYLVGFGLLSLTL